jgi:hypothetical protein
LFERNFKDMNFAFEPRFSKRDFLTKKSDRTKNGNWERVFEIVGFENKSVIFCECFPEIRPGYYYKLSIEDIEEDYTPHKRNEPPLVRCQRCGGYGTYPNYQTFGNQGNCPRCDGTGIARLEVKD